MTAGRRSHVGCGQIGEIYEILENQIQKQRLVAALVILYNVRIQQVQRRGRLYWLGKITSEETQGENNGLAVDWFPRQLCSRTLVFDLGPGCKSAAHTIPVIPPIEIHLERLTVLLHYKRSPHTFRLPCREDAWSKITAK